MKASMLKGNRAIIVQSPPRSGKTVCMAHIAKEATAKGNRVLFFCHRQEINDQVVKTFESAGVDMGLVMIGSVQSLARKLSSLPVPDLILVDEAHHIKANSYKKILGNFPSAYKLYFTGTPVRTNGEGFEELADDLILGKPVKWLQANGNIAPFRYYGPTLIDSSKLKKKAGEFTAKSIDEGLKKAVYGDVIAHYEKLAKGLQAIVYAHTVEAGGQVAKEFQKAGYRAAVLHGKTPKQERSQSMADFRAGKLEVMVNVELFTEGIDLPGVDCCIMLRPTQSLSLFLQFAMRPLNPREGKTAILIDHVGNSAIHGLPNADREWRIDGMKAIQRTYNTDGELVIKTCDSCFGCYESKEHKACPYCGEVPELTAREMDNIRQMELQEITEQNAKELKSRVANFYDASACQTIDELLEYKRQKGYKHGWFYHQAKKLGLL